MRKARSGARRGQGRSRPPLPAWATDDGTAAAELDGEPVEVRRLQPYQATKAYACPACPATIAPGTGHVVVVPVARPHERRHWHRSCWERREHRRPR